MPRSLRLLLELAFGLCCLELGLHGVQAVAPRAALLHEAVDPATRIAALRLPAGMMVWGTPTDARGFADHPPPPRSARTRRLILAVGGSNNLLYGPHALHFSTVAEQQLGDTEVYTAGIAGLDLRSFAELIRQEAALVQPDEIVLSLFLGDLLPPELGSSGVELLLPKLARELTRAGSAPGPRRLQGTRGRTPVPLQRFTYTHPWLWDPIEEPATMPWKPFLALERHRAQTMCTPSPELLTRIRRCLEDCQAAAGAIPLRALLIPDAFMVDDALWRYMELDLPRHGAHQAVSALCSELGIPTIDPLPAMLASDRLRDEQRHLYLHHDPHPNPRGHAILGRGW